MSDPREAAIDVKPTENVPRIQPEALQVAATAFVVLFCVPYKSFAARVLGRLLGVILTADGVADAVSPWFSGRLRDLAGSFAQSCFFLVGAALLDAMAVLGLPQRRKPA